MWSGIWSVATTRIGCWIETTDWGRKWLVDFNAGKTQLVLFDRSKNTGAIDVKGDGSVPGENHLLKYGCWLSLLNRTAALALYILLKLPPRKLEPWFILRSLSLLRLLVISLNLPCGHVWNTVVMSGLVLLVATWNCWISYKNGYRGLLVPHCCLSWTLGLLSKCCQLKAFL